MNLQQLKYVIAVAETKSITKAAGKLYISQPSLSNAIKDLETETGITLFVRSRSGVTLTKEGMEFLGYVRQVMQQFVPLFTAKPHAFLQKNHPLANKQKLRLSELEPYPRLNFVQGNYESSYYAEELFSTVPVDKEIRINDRGAIVNFMLGLNAYTISSGIFPKYLHGDNIIAVPLDESERMDIGYILPERQPLSELGATYIRELMKYAPTES